MVPPGVSRIITLADPVWVVLAGVLLVDGIKIACSAQLTADTFVVNGLLVDVLAPAADAYWNATNLKPEEAVASRVNDVLLLYLVLEPPVKVVPFAVTLPPRGV